MIIARDSGETRYLQGYKKQFPYLSMTSHGGPLTLMEGDLEPGDIELAAQIAARFGQGRNTDHVEFSVGNSSEEAYSISVTPMAADQINQAWYI